MADRPKGESGAEVGGHCSVAVFCTVSTYLGRRRFRVRAGCGLVVFWGELRSVKGSRLGELHEVWRTARMDDGMDGFPRVASLAAAALGRLLRLSIADVAPERQLFFLPIDRVYAVES